MSKWLVYKTKYFYDGHGEEDDGETEIFTTSDPWYAKVDPEKRYDCLDWYEPEEEDDLDEWIKGLEQDNDNLYAQDGYHTTAYGYSVVEITDQQEILINLTLRSYKDLWNYI